MKKQNKNSNHHEVAAMQQKFLTGKRLKVFVQEFFTFQQKKKNQTAQSWKLRKKTVLLLLKGKGFSHA
jgi:hypothetical protein